MKTKLLFFGMVLSMNLTFGQSNSNQSITNVNGAITQPIAPFATEIFRFRSGFVSQIDSGTGFGFTADRWFSLGRVSIAGANQNFYGLRFQQPNRGFVMGYNTLTATNPVIQWIGTGANLGNLEFRVANTFGSLGAPGADLLVSTMTKGGNTIFGTLATNPNNAKVAINTESATSLQLTTTAVSQTFAVGARVDTSGGTTGNIGMGIETFGNNSIGIEMNTTSISGSAIGVASFADGSNSQGIAFQGYTFGTATFEAAVEGNTPNNPNRFAGYFNGKVFATGTITSSDAKLKDNVQ